MSMPPQDFEKFLDLQRADYQRALPGKMAQIHALWRALDAGGEAPSPLADLERLAHTLAGAAGTFGFGEVGQAAKALELLLRPAVEGDGAGPAALTPQQRSDIARAIGELQASLPGD